MKTLADVEARTIVNAANSPGDAANSFIIRASGSYYLTGNIVGTPTRHGISIQASDVTLDLNGFALVGGGGAMRGVDVPTPQSGVTIRNGCVRSWGGGGVEASAAVTFAERLQLSDNAGTGGLAVGNGSVVSDCVATANTTGFRMFDRSQISNCIATINLIDGIVCTSFVSVMDCTSSRNGSTGIRTEASCSIIRCTATRNFPGGHGIVTGADCIVAECIASGNSGDGILAEAGTMVRGCNTSANGTAGIEVHGGSCWVSGNVSESNALDGILTTGSVGDNRLDGNMCNRNAFSGFRIDDNSGNLIIRNSASNNGPGNEQESHAYLIPTFNFVGPIANLRATGVATIDTTSPWANFIH